MNRSARMNTRIRYSRLPDGSFESMRIIVASNGHEYRVGLSADGLLGKIHSYSSGIVMTVKGTSAHKTKIAIKTLLMANGCEFEEEKRGNKSRG